MTKIYIDAGHGGSDPGAVGINGAKEAAVNLTVAKHLQTELKRQDIDVKMSRDTDIYKTLYARTAEANSYKADIVVSIHCNAYNTVSANGTETLIYKTGTKAEQIAKKVQENLLDVLGTTNRGVKTGNLAMVRDTAAPAILCELAFITNNSDCAKLTNTTYQKQCAVAICKGICSYLGLTYKEEATSTVTATTDYENHWAKAAIEKMKETKIMVGDGNGMFRPDEPITRAAVAQTMTNLLKYLGK